ncbi:DUF1428 family protein [Veronia pacifica]|uniref:DUF1428 domain-containing protein n=1 Tax=Veronia pacifica TaxID=1080227 RepID=A0A1C3EQU4_9GAMM|nr:DUF1428 family protein [Veronia pacifica]ODA35596.1 hypothetical protein A8L45_02935 [Veronia pacifica]
MIYVDGLVTALPKELCQSYMDCINDSEPLVRKHGALKVVPVQDDRLEKYLEPEDLRADRNSIVLFWIIWPSHEIRRLGMASVLSDPRLDDMVNPSVFHGKRIEVTELDQYTCH